MPIEVFTKQLDGCTYVSGSFNCTCASGADWLYRASQGRTRVSSCTIRRLTGDTGGGTNLDEIAAVMVNHYGIKTGRVYRPIKFSDLVTLLRSGYGAVIQGGYSVLRTTSFDASRRSFSGGHAIYASYANSTIIHAADPLADGRYSGCPRGYQNYPIGLLQQFADALPLGRSTLAIQNGKGYAYAYVTPRDPATVTRYTTAPLNLRNAVWGGTIYETMPTGTKLAVLATAHDSAGRTWYRVRDTRNAKTGYCAGWYTRS